MNCLQCSRLDLKEFPSHAREGMGVCALDKRPGSFVSFRKERECVVFAAAPADIVEKRVAWAVAPNKSKSSGVVK